ncbi:MAG TPA: hypothetical protein DCG57_14980 [Candidatus Riflebacteria bacterium]|nr:hypothetical protein [Candidatus Riflebacteria bacterium]
MFVLGACLLLLFPADDAQADQSYGSATLSRMTELKLGLLNYRSDLGHFPFAGNDSTDCHAYKATHSAGLGASETTNCLFKSEIAGFNYLGMKKEDYFSHWKGPYAETPPEELLFDYWGMPFVIVKHDKYLMLWSAGPDGRFDHLGEVMNKITNHNSYGDGYEGDDLIMNLARHKKTETNLHIDDLTEYACYFSKRGEMPQPSENLSKFIGAVFDLFW